MTVPVGTGRAAVPPEELVRRYFAEVVDGRSVATICELFAEDCRIFRADRATPIVGREQLCRFVRASIRAVPYIRTEIVSLVSQGDEIAARIAHEVRFGPVVITPLGPCVGTGAEASWQAMAFFRIADGRIVEERVIRDEMAILRQLGLLPAARRRAAMSTLRRLTRAVVPVAWWRRLRRARQ